MRRRLILRSASRTWATTGWNIAPITPGATPYPASRPTKNPATTWIARPQSDRGRPRLSRTHRELRPHRRLPQHRRRHHRRQPGPRCLGRRRPRQNATGPSSCSALRLEYPRADLPGRPQWLPPVRLTGRGPGALVCMDVLAFVTSRGRSSGVGPWEFLDSPLSARGPDQHEPGHCPASSDTGLQEPERL